MCNVCYNINYRMYKGQKPEEHRLSLLLHHYERKYKDRLFINMNTKRCLYLRTERYHTTFGRTGTA